MWAFGLLPRCVLTTCRRRVASLMYLHFRCVNTLDNMHRGRGRRTAAASRAPSRWRFAPSRPGIARGRTAVGTTTWLWWWQWRWRWQAWWRRRRRKKSVGDGGGCEAFSGSHVSIRSRYLVSFLGFGLGLTRSTSSSFLVDFNFTSTNIPPSLTLWTRSKYVVILFYH